MIKKPVAPPNTKKPDPAASPVSALPADLAKAQHGPGTSTSTGGATATRNTGAATGGAVTITISGSSSTSTSTETSTETETTGSGKGGGKSGGKGAAGKGAGKPNEKATGSGGPDTGDKRPHVYNITVNSTGQSGNAVDSSAGGEKEPELTMKDIKGWSGSQMRKKMKNPKKKAEINKVIAAHNKSKQTKTV